jgi:hypothetical protein
MTLKTNRPVNFLPRQDGTRFQITIRTVYELLHWTHSDGEEVVSMGTLYKRWERVHRRQGYVNFEDIAHTVDPKWIKCKKVNGGKV